MLYIITFILIHLCSTVFGQSPELFLKVHHSSSVNALVYSPDGDLLATAGADNTIKIWSASSGNILRTLSEHESDIFALAFSPDGRYLASAGYDRNVIVWDISTGLSVHSFHGHELPVTSVAFSPDSRFLASGSRDRRVIIWNVAEGSVQHTLTSHQDVVSCLAYNSLNNMLVSGDVKGFIRVWDTIRGVQIYSQKAHVDGVTALTFLDGGELLVTAGKDGQINMWSSENWSKIFNFKNSALQINAIAGDDRNRLLGAASDTGALIWVVPGQQVLHELHSHNAPVKAIAFSPDGSSVATSDATGLVNLWNTDTGSLTKSLVPQSFNINDIAFSPGGDLLVAANEDGSLKVWDVEKGSLVNSIAAHSLEVWSVTFATGGKIIASAGLDGKTKLWNTKNGTLIKTLSGSGDAVYAVDFSPDDRLLVTAGEDKLVHLWDVANGKRLRSLAGHLARIWSTDFNPNGSLLATASDDYTIRIWDVQRGELVKTLLGHKALVRAVRFSHDGRLMASVSSDKMVKIWETATGTLLSTMSGHSSSVKSVAFSPDGKILATGGFENIILIWDLANGLLQRRLDGHSNDINSVVFSPNGRLLASSSPDGSLRLWNIETGKTRFIFNNLPENQWLVQGPGSAYYSGSVEVSKFVGVRLAKEIHATVPLESVTKQLRTNNLAKSLKGPAPVLHRFEFTGKQVNPQIYYLWLAGFILLVLAGIVVAITLRRQTVQKNDVNRFFTQAGFSKIMVVAKNLMLLESNRQAPVLVLEWKYSRFVVDKKLLAMLNKKKSLTTSKMKLYVVYDNIPPRPDEIQLLREALSCVIIPVSSALLIKSLANKNCTKTLTELETPYRSRIDPYYELKPIQDAALFIGRNELLDRLPVELSNSGRIILSGLHKIGLTSLALQLKQLYTKAPVAYLDTALTPASAESCLIDILHQIRENNHLAEMEDLSIRESCTEIIKLHNAQNSGFPFLVILDRPDTFVQQSRIDKKSNITEYQKLLQALKSLVEKHRCISLLITTNNFEAVIVDLNRFGGNFQHETIGLLRPENSGKLLRSLGALSGISWSDEAVERMFYYCGGHPFVTRLFASRAVKQGRLRTIDLAAVESAADEIKATIQAGEIGNYFARGIWRHLTLPEKNVINLIATTKEQGFLQKQIPVKLVAALHSIESYGLAANDVGRLSLVSRLFYTWLQVQTTAATLVG